MNCQLHFLRKEILKITELALKKIKKIKAHNCKPRTQEGEAGGSGVLGQLGLYNEFKASLNYIVRPCLKTKTKSSKSQ